MELCLCLRQIAPTERTLSSFFFVVSSERTVLDEGLLTVLSGPSACWFQVKSLKAVLLLGSMGLHIE